MYCTFYTKMDIGEIGYSSDICRCCPVLGADFLADLGGIVQHEFGGDSRDVIGAAKCRFKVEPLKIAEALVEFLHDRGVGAGEPVDRLPIVADRSRC